MLVWFSKNIKVKQCTNVFPPQLLQNFKNNWGVLYLMPFLYLFCNFITDRFIVCIYKESFAVKEKGNTLIPVMRAPFIKSMYTYIMSGPIQFYPRLNKPIFCFAFCSTLFAF